MNFFYDSTNAQYLTNNDEIVLAQDLINACRASVEVLFYQNRKSLRTLCIEDFFQDVYLKSQSQIARFDSRKASLKTWVSTIARNYLIDFINQEKRRTGMSKPKSCNTPDEDGDVYVSSLIDEYRDDDFAQVTGFRGNEFAQIAGYRGDEFEADRDLQTAEAVGIITDARNKLCGSRRQVVELMEEGYKPREIAKITGWTPEKVYGARCWARKDLVELLGREFLQENGIAA